MAVYDHLENFDKLWKSKKKKLVQIWAQLNST